MDFEVGASQVAQGGAQTASKVERLRSPPILCAPTAQRRGRWAAGASGGGPRAAGTPRSYEEDEVGGGAPIEPYEPLGGSLWILRLDQTREG